MGQFFPHGYFEALHLRLCASHIGRQNPGRKFRNRKLQKQLIIGRVDLISWAVGEQCVIHHRKIIMNFQDGGPILLFTGFIIGSHNGIGAIGDGGQITKLRIDHTAIAISILQEEHPDR